ncbi:polysaccharide biosynthesis/export family protein [uncultured Aliiroseovarius sp.]|uniref:polysaccharide biosynthesis/export family protein n=1 Tax=uncultured Aliiroseovarius sp. TaxID=1658783 RepID=UPI002628921E|nr:polysaccharide biosynthesis/export family protein [uncultured Aliiroseovarius sp.]
MSPLRKIILTVLATLLAATLPALGEDYVLNEQDELLVRVLRWDSEQDAYAVLDGVSGEYTIGSNGTLSLPLIGSLAAKGETVTTLSRQLAIAIERKLGLSPPPRIGVQVIGHLPVYVLGAVSSPGAYPYRPGLTAQQAMALSGGLLRTNPGDQNGFTFDTMRLGGEVRMLENQIEAHTAEQQQLLADLEALNAQEASGDDGMTELPQGLEADILAAKQNARAAQGERIRDLQAVLREQIDRLTAQIALRADQIVTTEAELKDVSSLKERGLTVNTRVNALTSALNELEAKRLQLEIARLTAQQQLNRAQRDELALVDDARAETLARLNAVERDISGLQIRLATARALRAQAVSAGMAVPDTVGEMATRYRVTRVVDGVATTSDIRATDPMRPGDTIEIDRVDQAMPDAN